jgi:hypothetical protein
MPRRLLQAAPSRLACYLDCPRRYRFTYLDRPPPPKGPPWAHNSVGAAVHTALASWWKAPPGRRTVSTIAELLDEAWLRDGFRDTAQCERARERMTAILQRYVARLDPAAEPVGVERTVALKTHRAALFGRVDRIDDRADEGLVIVDYKSGRQRLTVDDARTSLALAVYAAGTQRTLRRPCQVVELHHLPTGDVLRWEHSAESLARHVRRADSIAAEIADLHDRMTPEIGPEDRDAMFPAVVGPQCGWCDYLRSCPQGSAATTARPPWAGIEDSEPNP